MIFFFFARDNIQQNVKDHKRPITYLFYMYVHFVRSTSAHTDDFDSFMNGKPQINTSSTPNFRFVFLDFVQNIEWLGAKHKSQICIFSIFIYALFIYSHKMWIKCEYLQSIGDIRHMRFIYKYICMIFTVFAQYSWHLFQCRCRHLEYSYKYICNYVCDIF